MREITLVMGIFVLALVSAFVPFASIEVALILAAATSTSSALLACQVIAAAAGQMIGKSCFFLGGRTVSVGYWRRRNARAPRRQRRLGAVIDGAARHRAAAFTTVLAAAITGLPPFALVSALAGAWRLRLSSFFMLGFTGRTLRFAGVLLIPTIAGWR